MLVRHCPCQLQIHLGTRRLWWEQLVLERECLALYHGSFGDLGDTYLLTCQLSWWREISVELTILFPYFTFFLSLVFKILPFTYFYPPRLFESGDIERAWLTRSVVSNTLIHFDFYTFLADTRTTIHIGAILFASVLYCHMWIFKICAQIPLRCPCTSPYIYTPFFSFIPVSGRGQLAYWATVFGYHGDHSERPVFCI